MILFMEPISNEEMKNGVETLNLTRYASRSQKKAPDTLIGWRTALSPKPRLKVTVLRWKNFWGCLPPKKAVLTKCKVMNVISSFGPR
jgi:hypothetical protein